MKSLSIGVVEIIIDSHIDIFCLLLGRISLVDISCWGYGSSSYVYVYIADTLKNNKLITFNGWVWISNQMHARR